MAMNSGIMSSFHEEDLWPLDENDVSLFLKIKSGLLDPFFVKSAGLIQRSRSKRCLFRHA
jgi:hypothetical protein